MHNTTLKSVKKHTPYYMRQVCYKYNKRQIFLALICVIYRQVVFEGLKQQRQPTINIDDISFTNEVCGKIARE